MSKKKKLLVGILGVLAVIINIGILTHQSASGGPIKLQMNVRSDITDQVQVYYSPNDYFNEKMTDSILYQNVHKNGMFGKNQRLDFTIDTSTKNLRIDLGNQPGRFEISDLRVVYRDQSLEISLRDLIDSKFFSGISDKHIKTENNGKPIAVISTSDTDPYIGISVNLSKISTYYANRMARIDLVKNIVIVLILDVAFLFLFRYRNKIISLPAELFQNRHLIISLSKNDFKTKYAGSYLGIIWAFIQPVVTILVYWFVFQVGLKNGSVEEVPFVLWMIAGLVPWFFFSDTLNSGTSALLEYSYLVKKVVFKISILPIVKEISALYVHLFFVAFTVFLYACYGYFPDLYTLQVLYYTFCMFILALGISYATCAIVIFFRDLTQIINIILQVGVWITPIMWNIDTMEVPKPFLVILKGNPLYYVVSGYRDSLINKVWFFEHFDMTIYFWVVTALVFGLGTVIFKRLKVHFADVL